MFDYRLSDFIRFLERAARAVNGGLRRYENNASAALARRTPRFQKKAEHCLSE
jgi:hypothetical protein